MLSAVCNTPVICGKKQFYTSEISTEVFGEKCILPDEERNNHYKYLFIRKKSISLLL